MKDWDETKNWALIIIGLFTFLTVTIFRNIEASHKEDMEHIKQGHCLVPSIGTDRKYWTVCK